MKQPEAIHYQNGVINVPNHVIIPFITGDGIGGDIAPIMIQVVNEAVRLSYQNQRKIHWLEVLAGERAVSRLGDDQWLPQATLDAFKHYHVGIKGPLTTPVGGGIRSLNVLLRQSLDLFVCLRPVRYYQGTPSPVKRPEEVDMVIFRENSEDIYVGIEAKAGSETAENLITHIQSLGMGHQLDKHTTGIGVKPISKHGTERLVHQAIQYALVHNRSAVTLVHKGNIMKYTEGAFCQWGYDLAKREFGAKPLDGGPWLTIQREGRDPLVIKDVIADAFFQHALLHPKDHDVIASTNLNGDYISDALAAQVGGIGIAPGANLSQDIAIFEATHGTAPKHAGKNEANPSSLVLSAMMMLEHMQWNEAAMLMDRALEHLIIKQKVTYDFAQFMPGSVALSTSEFGQAWCNEMSLI